MWADEQKQKHYFRTARLFDRPENTQASVLQVSRDKCTSSSWMWIAK